MKDSLCDEYSSYVEEIKQLKQDIELLSKVAKEWQIAALEQQEFSNNHEGRAMELKEALEKIIKEDIYLGPDGEEVHGDCGMIALVALGRAT